VRWPYLFSKALCPRTKLFDLVTLAEFLVAFPTGQLRNRLSGGRVRSGCECAPSGLLAYPIQGGSPIRICTFCDAAWSHDEGFFYLRLRNEGGGEGGRAFVLALPSGKSLPKLPRGGVDREEDLAGLPVVRTIELMDVPHISFSIDPAVYAFSRVKVQRNLFRIPLR
jgi:hypothetical protein